LHSQLICIAHHKTQNHEKDNYSSSFIIGYFILMSSLGIIAAAPGTAQKSTREKDRVRREIVNSISCPSFVTENSPANRVTAIVNVDEAGIVSVSEINSANPQLSSYVIGQLQNMKVKTTGLAEKFVLVVNFKVD
jgi:hypothetical protein